jgi:hypothetical protein
MKKLLSLSVFMLTLGLLTFVACKKDTTDATTAQTEAKLQSFQGVSLVGDHLSFEHDGYIQVFTDAMLKDKEGSIKRLEAQFPTFRSNRTAYQELEKKIEQDLITPEMVGQYKHLITIVKENGEDVVEKTIDATVLATICNEQGYFQLENTLYHIDRNFVLEIDAKTGVEKKRTKIVRQEEELAGSVRTTHDNDIEYDCNGRKNIRARLYANSYVIFSEAGTIARVTKKALIGWSNTDVPSLNLTSNYTISRLQLTSALIGNNTNVCSTTNFVANMTGLFTSEVEHVGTACWTCCNTALLIIGSTSTSTATDCGKSRSITKVVTTP